MPAGAGAVPAPGFLQKKFRFELPDTLEIIILLFIFAAEILGELQCYFVEYPHWDTMLHTTSGFLAAAVGFSLVDLLNRDAKIKFQLSPLYVAIAGLLLCDDRRRPLGVC